MLPQTRYAKSGDVNIAYQVLGQGLPDLALIPGWVSNIEIFWEEPTVVRFLTRLASFSRLILFDKRGTGLSDRVAEMPNLETRQERSAFVDRAVREWGTPIDIDMRAPSMALDERFRQWWARFLRRSASPAAFATLSDWAESVAGTDT